MWQKLEQVKDSLKAASGQVTDAATKVVQHPNTKAAANLAKEAVTEAAYEVADQARQISKSQIAKDVASGAVIGAAIGAVVAGPIPWFDWPPGAMIGAGIGALMGFKRAWGSNPQGYREATAPLDFHKEMTGLDDLRQKGILSQEEFDGQKKKLLRKR